MAPSNATTALLASRLSETTQPAKPRHLDRHFDSQLDR